MLMSQSMDSANQNSPSKTEPLNVSPVKLKDDKSAANQLKKSETFTKYLQPSDMIE